MADPRNVTPPEPWSNAPPDLGDDFEPVAPFFDPYANDEAGASTWSNEIAPTALTAARLQAAIDELRRAQTYALPQPVIVSPAVARALQLEAVAGEELAAFAWSHFGLIRNVRGTEDESAETDEELRARCRALLFGATTTPPPPLLHLTRDDGAAEVLPTHLNRNNQVRLVQWLSLVPLSDRDARRVLARMRGLPNGTKAAREALARALEAFVCEHEGCRQSPLVARDCFLSSRPEALRR